MVFLPWVLSVHVPNGHALEHRMEGWKGLEPFCYLGEISRLNSLVTGQMVPQGSNVPFPPPVRYLDFRVGLASKANSEVPNPVACVSCVFSLR